MTEEIKEKIRKLLALSMSDNPHEAALAAERAVELMNRHGINEGDLDKDPFITQEFQTGYKNAPTWYLTLWSLLMSVSGCTSAYRSHSVWVNEAMVVAGRKRDVENAIYMGQFFTREIAKKIKGKRFKTRALANDYKKGLAIAIAVKVAKAQKSFFSSQPQGSGLVPVDVREREANEFLEQHYSMKDSTRNFKARKSEAFRAGVRDAEDLNLSHGVSDRGRETLALPGGAA